MHGHAKPVRDSAPPPPTEDSSCPKETCRGTWKNPTGASDALGVGICMRYCCSCAGASRKKICASREELVLMPMKLGWDDDAIHKGQTLPGGATRGGRDHMGSPSAGTCWMSETFKRGTGVAPASRDAHRCCHQKELVSDVTHCTHRTFGNKNDDTPTVYMLSLSHFVC